MYRGHLPRLLQVGYPKAAFGGNSKDKCARKALLSRGWRVLYFTLYLAPQACSENTLEGLYIFRGHPAEVLFPAVFVKISVLMKVPPWQVSVTQAAGTARLGEQRL